VVQTQHESTKVFKNACSEMFLKPYVLFIEVISKLLTPKCIILFEKLIVTQPVKQQPA
jgi:hypothetical protein